jgi:hypothetical protein
MSMTDTISRTAMLLARRIAGAERDDWVRAMAAEWDALESGKIRWALGCLGAAAHDRVRREWRTIALMVAALPVLVVWSTLAMIQIAPSLREAGAPWIAWMIAYLVNPLPVAAMLGWLMPRRAMFLGLATGTLFLAAPFLASVLVLDVPIRAWLSLVGGWGFGLAAYPLALIAWALAARAGAGLARRRGTAA